VDELVRQLGESIVDMGSPLGAPRTVASGGSVKDGAADELSGYSIVEAADMADAADKAKGCPVLSGGGQVEVYESLPVG
jgi:hypothetical protein